MDTGHELSCRSFGKKRSPGSLETRPVRPKGTKSYPAQIHWRRAKAHHPANKDKTRTKTGRLSAVKYPGTNDTSGSPKAPWKTAALSSSRSTSSSSTSCWPGTPVHLTLLEAPKQARRKQSGACMHVRTSHNALEDVLPIGSSDPSLVPVTTKLSRASEARGKACTAQPCQTSHGPPGEQHGPPDEQSPQIRGEALRPERTTCPGSDPDCLSYRTRPRNRCNLLPTAKVLKVIGVEVV